MKTKTTMKMSRAVVSASRVWRGRAESERVRARAREQRACERARETQCRGGMEATTVKMMTMKMMTMTTTQFEFHLARQKPMQWPEQCREICRVNGIILSMKHTFILIKKMNENS